MRAQQHTTIVLCIVLVAMLCEIQAAAAQPLFETSTANTSYYVYPPNLHLAAGVTSVVPLTIVDDNGKTVSGNVTYHGYDTSLISISGSGYVTALRAERSSEIGTWVHATINEVPVANTTVVRVFSKELAVPFSQLTGENTVLYYPTNVNGENLSTYVTRHQIPLVNEYAYSIQHQLMGVIPFNGARQVFEVDFGEGETQWVCGISGNPIRLGWYIHGNEWQNCFLTPNIAPRSPVWDVMYHELGHNFTWASQTFGQCLSRFEYSEGVATAISAATIQTILNNPSIYSIGTDATASLRRQYTMLNENMLNRFKNWLNSGADFGRLDPDIVDGIWLHYYSQHPDDFAQRFFRPLQPGYATRLSVILDNLSESDQHTIFAALVSAAMRQNLSSIFSNSYHYPIDSSLFTSAYTVFGQIMDNVIRPVYIPIVFNNYRPFIRLSLQTDPSNDWISPTPRNTSMDIRQTSVWLIDANYLRFEMQLEGAIPAASLIWRFYGWFLDTDLNSNTGQQYNDIGSDYNVQVTYFPDRGWVGQIFDIKNSGLIELNSIVVSGNTANFTVPLNAIGSPGVFNWISIDQDDVPYSADITPNTGHIHTTLPSK